MANIGKGGGGGSTNNLKQGAAYRVNSGSNLASNPPNGWSSAQAKTASLIMVLFQAAGLSKAGAAGFVGNWYQESALNPSSPGGYLGQWTGSRLASLIALGAQMGQPVTNVQVQVAFTIQELRTQYPKLLQFLQTTNEPGKAALAISAQYERPAAWAANNANRVLRARQAFGEGPGTQGVAGAQNPPASGGGGFGSVLDILNSPVDAIGGWIAQIALNLTKDVAIGIFDAIILPFWHWNQRAVSTYSEAMFGTPGTATSPQAWEMTLWNATFWGLGYWLLFTDPTQKTLSLKALKPGPARKSRAARHARFVQSIPARRRLTKPADVASSTATKPTPVVSYVSISKMDTMQTHRPERVKVTSSGGTVRTREHFPREPARTSPESKGNTRRAA